MLLTLSNATSSQTEVGGVGVLLISLDILYTARLSHEGCVCYVHTGRCELYYGDKKIIDGEQQHVQINRSGSRYQVPTMYLLRSDKLKRNYAPLYAAFGIFPPPRNLN